MHLRQTLLITKIFRSSSENLHFSLKNIFHVARSNDGEVETETEYMK